MPHRLLLAALFAVLISVLIGSAVLAQMGTSPGPATTATGNAASPDKPSVPDVKPPVAPAAEPVKPEPLKPEDTPPVPTPNPELKLFGRDLFQNAGIGTVNPFEPNADTAVPADYVLGPGDTLAVTCWSGTTEYERANIAITPSGDLYLKLLGTVPLALKTLAQAEAELRARYGKFYKKFDLRVQVVGRRTIPVFVMGEVARPNKYMLSSLSTVFTALFAAGGPTDIGSLRKIRLMRGRLVVGEIDIYDYLLRGQAVDLPLKAGDTVFVPMAGKVVTVGGEVRRPAKYELLDADKLTDAITMAGGTTASSAERIRLSRIGDNRERQVVDLSLRTDAASILRDGDEIYVHPVLSIVRNAVTLTGAVNRPGTYPVEKAATVGALLKLAEGARTDAYIEQAEIARLQADGLVVKFTIPLRAILDKSNVDVPLQAGDELRVFLRTELAELRDRVTVQGEVVKPGSYPFKEGMRLADLLQLAFGPTIQAYLSQAHLFRYPSDNRPVTQAINLEKVLAGDATENVVLQRRDILRVYNRSQVSDLVDMVRIEGEVVKPDSYPYQAGMTVTDLVRKAFGVTTQAYLPQVLVYRYPLGDRGQMVAIDLAKALGGDKAEDITLQPRDRVVVKSRADVTDLVVRVEGEVEKPGALPFYQGMRITDALFLAGGLKADVAMDRALLIRFNEKTYAEELVEISLRDVLADKPEQNLTLANKDRLIIYPIAQMGEQQVVRVEGAVTAPGSYAYVGNMRVGHLLFLAKGLVKDAFADRANLYRLLPDNTTQIIPVNLVKALSGAQMEENPLLRPRDRLVVATRDEMMEPLVVKVDGYVRNPGTYPLTVGMKLTDLLMLAGGMQPEADPLVDVYRLDQDRVRTLSFEMSERNGILQTEVDPLLQANDLVSVRGNADFVKMTETVAVEGKVLHPGVYPAYQGTRQTPKTLYALLMESGGVLADSYPAGIVLYRKESALHSERQKRELERTMRNLDASVGIPAIAKPSVTNSAAGKSATANDGVTAPASTTPVPTIKEQNLTNMSRTMAQAMTTDRGNTVVLITPPRSMQEQEFSLSIPIDADALLQSQGKLNDITLEPGDTVYVPTRPTTVTVLGGVVNNGRVVFATGKGLDHYLTKVGGIAPDGEKKGIIVMRMNGLVLPQSQVKSINPGDIIVVPTKHMLQIIHTRGPVERALQTISEAALSFLPFTK